MTTPAPIPASPRLNSRLVHDTGVPCPRCADIGHTTFGGNTPTLRRLPDDQRHAHEPDLPFCVGPHGYIHPPTADHHPSTHEIPVVVASTVYNPLNADCAARDVHNLFSNVAGRIDDVCRGDNPACERGRRGGRPVHIVPPRYANDGASLVMPDYHFATVAEAQDAYLAAREQAVVATSFAHRDDLYGRADRRAVWIPFGLNA